MVTDSAPWRRIVQAEKSADSFAPLSEVPLESGTFVSLVRGVADDVRVSVRLGAAAALRTTVTALSGASK
jgi:hypothetical protein